MFGFAKPHRRLIAGFLAFTIVDASLVVVIPLLIKRIVDDGITPGNTSVVVWLAVAMAGAALFDALLGDRRRLPLLADR